LGAAIAAAADSNRHATSVRRNFVVLLISRTLDWNERLVLKADALLDVTKNPAYLVRLNSTKSRPI
jgi:hypothetical protein